ncbi:hypothetical protein MUP77_12400 [Candidatus Bathyarchaeota archaeon]|nr:hypothetical protein [Candidatus Bathyarchaeota archaeon]
MTGLLSKNQREYLEGKSIKKGPNQERQLRYNIRNKAKSGIKDYELLAKYLNAKDHENVFNMDNFVPLFTALYDYGVKNEVDKGPIKNVRLFKLFINLSNLCLNGCKALFSPEFIDLVVMGSSSSIRFISKEDLNNIQIAHNAILLNEGGLAKKTQ